jgi:hypothetical protein
MIRQKQEINEYLGTIFFLVLFFLFFFAFNSNQGRSYNHSYHYEITSEIHSNVLALNDNHQYYSKKEIIPVSKIKVLKFFTEDLKINSDNRISNQRMAFLQKTLCLLKPFYPPKFRFQYHCSDTGILPVLS